LNGNKKFDFGEQFMQPVMHRLELGIKKVMLYVRGDIADGAKEDESQKIDGFSQPT
jgi:hypothetical protein